MTPVVILQARTNSSRLPAKVLLPVSGMPLVVLAARRAANKGLRVIVATSNEPSDDALARILQENSIYCFRGSLNNVLKRFVDALSGQPENTIVVRLTADNVLPDGSFLDEMIRDFCARKLEYLCCGGQLSGLPYGMSAEVIRLKALREALTAPLNDYEREHVTPYVLNRYGRAYFEKYRDLKQTHYRCTVDSFDDYLNVLDLFSTIDDPVKVPALHLVKVLSGCRNQPTTNYPVTKLVVGTAQLGMDYGIGNKTGRPDDGEIERLLKMAVTNGVIYVDTARSYGESEEVIGRVLSRGWEQRCQVITKLSPLTDCPEGADGATCRTFVDASIFSSCLALQRSALDVLLLHRFSHVTDWQGSVWQRLLEHRNSGRIKTLGVSVQNPQELTEALDLPQVSFIQMPFNILDQRWDRLRDKIRQMRSERGLTIHVRSSFLQGLYLSRELTLWKKAHVPMAVAEEILNWFDQMVVATDRKNIADFCLAYLRTQDWIDGIVVGMESCRQLEENIAHFSASSLNCQQLERLEANRPILKEQNLNPSLWQRG